MLDNLDGTSGSSGFPGTATLPNTVVNGGYVTPAAASATAAAQAANPVVSTITVQAASGDAIFKLELDAKAAAAPAAYISGFTTAATLLSEAIHDPITVNLEIGYTEFPEDNSPIASDLALGGDASNSIATYSQLKSFLSATGASDVVSALAALPNTSSLNGVTNFSVASAQEKVFGQISSSATAIDGYVGFGSGFGNFIVGAALHEFTHAMGRLVGDSVLSLFRYTSPGTHYFGDSIPAPATYFSVDGGKTALADFGKNSDPADFLNNSLTPNDPFNEIVGGNSLTALDRTILDMLGFGGSGLSPPPPPPPPPVAPVVNVQNVSVPAGGWIPGASLIISVSNPSGDVITAYEFEDEG
ncbi:MAG: NF038122 family metalloprotease, partial [Bradyrhizobium sp.]